MNVGRFFRNLFCRRRLAATTAAVPPIPGTIAAAAKVVFYRFGVPQEGTLVSGQGGGKRVKVKTRAGAVIRIGRTQIRSDDAA